MAMRYRLELNIANLTDGKKVAYVKSYIEKADNVTAEKIKKEETAGKTRLNQPSDNSIRNPEPVVNQKNSDRDSTYMDAIKRGDMENAQKMVEQAAKDSGYTRLFYHGSKKGGGFTIFRDWQYFTENKEYAKRYTEKGKAESLYTTYVKMDNPFDTRITEVRKLFRDARMEYGMGELQENGLPDWTDGYDIADYIDENDAYHRFVKWTHKQSFGLTCLKREYKLDMDSGNRKGVSASIDSGAFSKTPESIFAAKK